MSNIQFQIQHSKYIPESEIIEKLHSVISTTADLPREYDIEDIEDWLEYDRGFILPNEIMFSTFSLDLNGEIPDTEIEQLISDFLKDLKDIEGVEEVIKYYDSHILEKSLQYHKEIYEIEMKLREIINYILLFDDKLDYKKVFPDFNTTKIDFPKETAKNQFENQLFYMSFEDYIKFERARDLTNQETATKIQQASSFDDFKEFVEARNIKTLRHINFISSIKDKVSSVKDLRNATMHNRAISKKKENNYLKIKDELFESIEYFWENEQEELKGKVLSRDYEIIETKLKEYIFHFAKTLIWEEEEKKAYLNTPPEYSGEPFEYSTIDELIEMLSEEAQRWFEEELQPEWKFKEDTFDGCSFEEVVFDVLEANYTDEIELIGWELK